MESLVDSFAELYPCSNKANSKLRKQLLWLEQKPNEYLSALLSEKEDNSDMECDTDSSASVSTTSYRFLLSMDNLPVTREWRIGKGQYDDCTLEFCLSPSRTPKLYAFLKFHPRSGFLMLNAPNRDVMINRNGFWSTVRTVCLSTKATYIRFGSLVYCLSYKIKDGPRYIALRNRFVGGTMRNHEFLHGFPKHDDAELHGWTIHGTITNGASGIVSAGVHSVSGEPIAIKEINIRRGQSNEETIREAKFSLQFKEKIRGILQIEETRCEHGEQLPCGKKSERYYIVSRLGSCDFTAAIWSRASYSGRLALFKMTLEGLYFLHNSGYIHRDITRQNLLVVSVDPLDAVISDFGKMIQSSFERSTFIGPVCTCAPEVWGEEGYTNAIDIWSLGYAWLETFLSPFNPGFDKIDERIHVTLLKKIDHLREKAEICESFADLLRRMLSWNAETRITASEALNCDIWTTSAGYEPSKEENLMNIIPKVSGPSLQQRKSAHIEKRIQTRLSNGSVKRFRLSHTAVQPNPLRKRKRSTSPE